MAEEIRQIVEQTGKPVKMYDALAGVYVEVSIRGGVIKLPYDLNYCFNGNGYPIIPQSGDKLPVTMNRKQLYFLNEEGKPDWKRTAKIVYENSDVCSFKFANRVLIGRYNEKTNAFEIPTVECTYEYKLYQISEIKYIGKL